MSSGTPGRLDKVLAHATLAGRPSGSILRLERLSLRIEQKAFAKALGTFACDAQPEATASLLERGICGHDYKVWPDGQQVPVP